MKKAKKQRLEAAGWRVGNASEFLGLSPEESAIVEMKLALAAGVKESAVSLAALPRATSRRAWGRASPESRNLKAPTPRFP